MKILQTLTFILSIFLLSVTTVKAQINLQDNLKVHLKLDDTAVDASGNDIAVTKSNGVFPANDYTGQAQSAMYFNGNVEQGLISLPVGFIDNMNEITICAWVRPLQFVSGGQGIFGQDNVLEISAYSGANRIRVWHPVSGNIDYTVTGAVGTWYHVAVTASTTGLKVYINGEEKASRTGNYKLTSSAYSTNLGARVLAPSSNNYYGTIDDFRIYERVLTTDEINFLSSNYSLTYNINSLPTTTFCTGASFNVPFTVVGTNVADTNTFSLQLSNENGNFDNPVIIGTTTGKTSGNIDATLPTNLVSGNGYKLRIVSNLPLFIGNISTQSLTINNPSEGKSTLNRGKILEYLFDTNINDNSGFGNHGTTSGGVSYVDDRFGNPMKAVQLNGTSGYINVPAAPWFDAGAFTAASWVKVGSYNNYGRVIDFGNGSNSDNISWSLSQGTTGKQYCDFRNGSTATGTVLGEQIPLNKWTHIAISYNGTTLKMYMNGNLVGSGAVSPSRLIYRANCYIGKSNWTSDAYANAAYDDFAIWNRTLTEDEIRTLASNGSIVSNSPVCSGNTLYLNAPNINGATYSWSGPNGFTSSTKENYIPNVTSANSGTYKVTITVEGCTYVDSLTNVTVQTPSSQATTSFTGLAADTYLGANASTLTGTPTGGYFAGSGIANTTFTPADAGLGNHKIIYNYLNSGSCYSNNVLSVNVHPSSTINLGEEVACSGYFYDSGGSGANYGNNETIIKTFTSANGEFLQFTFTNSSIAAGDTLFAYDGKTVNDRILVAYTSGSRWEGFTSSGTSVTFKFVSNASGTSTGWTAQYICTSTPQQSKNYNISNSIVSICTGKFYDDGGPSGNHGDVGSYTQTFYSRTGNKIKFSFTSFNTAGGSDIVRFYDGPNTNYPLLTSRSSSQGTFSVESTSDVLTVTFSMFQNGLTAAGWAADISCTEPPLPAYNLVDTTITVCSAIIYDHAGPAANYNANRNDKMVIKSGSNQLLKLVFNHNETGIAAGDTLFIYDGDNVNRPVIAKFISGSRLDNVISSGTALTLVFKSDGATQGKGFMATLSCIDAPAVVDINLSTGERGLCSGIVRDPGGTGNYSVGTNTTQVFRSLNGNRLKLNFSELAINGNNGGHWLNIYDGPNNTYPLIGSYNQWAWPPESIVQSTGEYMTLNFNSTNSSAGAAAGFTAEFSCTTPPLEIIPMTKGSFTICDAVICDNGGITANYKANAKDTTTLCSANGQLLQVLFNHNETAIAAGDTLWIYDGLNASSPQLGRYISGSRLDNISSTGTYLTFVFKSDGTTQGKGWQGIVSCISKAPEKVAYIMSSGERNICGGTFYDDGGTANYARGTWTQTFTSYSKQRIRATRTSFNVNGNNGGHWLSVYDGSSTASPKIGDYNNFTAVPSVFQSTGSSLTFYFNSSNTSAGLSAGWSFDMACFSGEPIDVDWVESPICAGSTIELTYTLNETTQEGNEFRAQLSDANGNFNSPVTIGSVANTLSGTITATIPAGIASGNKYRIRIISTNPAMIGAVSPNPIVIYALPATPTVSASGNLEICNGNGSVTLSTTAQTGVNYRWIKDGTETVGTNQNSYTATTAGIYTVEVSNTCDTIASSNSKTVVVTNPAIAPSITLSGTTDICSNEQVTLSVIKNTSCTYQWYKNTATIGVNDTTLTTSSAGAYTVKLTNICGSVWAIDTIDITIKGTPPVIPTISNATSLSICEGNSVELSITPQTGVNYQWILNNTTHVGDNSEVLAAKDAGTYKIEVSNSCGAEVSNNTKTVVVNYKPTVPVISSEKTSICYGDSITLSTAEQANATYQWKKDGNPVGSNSKTLVVKESGSYSVEVTNNCGTTSSTQTKNVTVFELPTKPLLSANGSTSFCPYETIELNTTTNGEAISWYHNNNYLTGKTAAILSVSQAGSYKTRLTNTNNCWIESDAITVEKLTAPNASITADKTAFCPDAGAITLTANTDPLASYKWLKDNELSDVSTATFAATEKGTYKAILSYENGCIDTSNAITLTIAENPIARITSAGTSICSGSSINLIADVVPGATYTWYKNTSIVKGPGTSNTLSVNAADNYSVVVKNTDLCSATSSTVTIEVLSLPEVSLSASGSSFCQGSSVDLTATVINGATYEWFRNNVSLGTPTLNKNTYIVTQTGTYKAVVNNGCAGTSNAIVVTENTTPAAAGNISGNTAFCPGKTESYSVPIATGATNYKWEIIPSSAGSITTGQGTRNITIGWKNVTAQLKVTPNNYCGDGASKTLNVVVDNSTFCTIGTILFSASQTNICLGSSVTFTNYTNETYLIGTTANWNFGAGASPTTATGKGPHTVTYSTSGLKTITLEYRDMWGYPVNSEIKYDYINVANAVVTTSEIQTDVTNSCPTIKTFSVTNTVGSSYAWVIPSGAILLNGQGYNQITVDFNGTIGDVLVTETTAAGCVGNTKKITVDCGVSSILVVNNEKNDWSFYPNPASDQVYITCNKPLETELVITNTIGQVVCKQYINSLTRTYTIDVNQYSTGIYYLRIGSQIQKLIIRR